MTIKIEIKNRWTGKVLFELEKENNTIKDTLIEAVKQGADLRSADLCGANLCGADLCGANLCGANLRGAYLGSAYLCGAYLGSANLGGANLGSAHLGGANLRGANLCGAYLGSAYLCGAYLGSANLGGAHLGSANLRSADLCGANLCGADLRYAHLGGADIGGADKIPFIPYSCPSDGSFIGWKKVRGHLVQLEIPEDAKRLSSTGTKCRCDKAKVIGITNLDTKQPVDAILNVEYSPYVEYKVGEMVFPDSFDDDRWNECSHGIHFFINKQEAIDY